MPADAESHLWRRLAELRDEPLDSILKAPIVAATPGRRLGSFLEGPGTGNNLSITFGDLFYEIIRLEPAVLDRLPTGYEQMASFLSWPWSSDPSASPSSSIYKVAQHLQAQGFEVLLDPDHLTEDLILVSGGSFKVALSLSDADVTDYLVEHPTVGVFVSGSSGVELQSRENVYVLEQNQVSTAQTQADSEKRRSEFVPDVDDVLNWSGQHHIISDWTWTSISAGRKLCDLIRGDLEAFGKNEIVDRLASVAAGSTGKLLGAKLMGAAGFCFFGPAGGLVGGVAGDRLAQAKVQKAADWLKEKTLLRSQVAEVIASVQEFLRAAIPAAEFTKSTFAKKREQIESRVGSSALAPLLTAVQWRLKDEWIYRKRKADEVTRAASDTSILANGDSLRLPDAAALLVRQAGIHGHFVKPQRQRVEKAVESLLTARKRYKL